MGNFQKVRRFRWAVLRFLLFEGETQCKKLLLADCKGTRKTRTSRTERNQGIVFHKRKEPITETKVKSILSALFTSFSQIAAKRQARFSFKMMWDQL